MDTVGGDGPRAKNAEVMQPRDHALAVLVLALDHIRFRFRDVDVEARVEFRGESSAAG